MTVLAQVVRTEMERLRARDLELRAQTEEHAAALRLIGLERARIDAKRELLRGLVVAARAARQLPPQRPSRKARRHVARPPAVTAAAPSVTRRVIVDQGVEFETTGWNGREGLSRYEGASSLIGRV